MNIHFAMIKASLKMYFRDKQALFWSLFFPLLIMLIFGIIDFDRFSPPDVGVVDNASSPVSQAFVESLKKSGDRELLKVQTGTHDEMFEDLRKGDVDAVIEVPANFGAAGVISSLDVTYDSRKPQEGGFIGNVLDGAIESLFQEVAQVPGDYRIESRFAVNETSFEGQGQGYRGFLIPGVAAMSIMQGGLFGVVFTIVAFKSRGILRRLKAAPIKASHVLTGQVATRLVVSVLQTYVLLVVGIIVLGVTIGGDVGAWLGITVFALLGGTLFIAMGLAISGWAKSEDTAAPVANVISLPMMFLSGVFFPVTSMPGWVQAVSKFLPLTYLADGMRAVAIDRIGLASQWPELLGLSLWALVMFVVATRLFKWE